MVNMITVDVKGEFLRLSNLFQFCDVDWDLHIPLIPIVATYVHLVIRDLRYKSCQKLPQFIRDVVRIDISTPKNLSIT